MAASGSGVPWPQNCAVGEDRTAAHDYREEAIDAVVQCKEEYEAGDRHADLQTGHCSFYDPPRQAHSDVEVAAVTPQISSDWSERQDKKSRAPAEEQTQVTHSPEQHARVGYAPNPAMNPSEGSASAPKVQDGIPGMAYKCRYCRLSFDNKMALLAHQKTHVSSRLYRCPECPQSFTDNAMLVAHHWTFHRPRPAPEDKPFSCNECGRTFTKKSSLVKHQRLHTGAFSCPDCGKCLSDKTGLILHRRTHTGEKPFACSECGKRFTQMCHLVTHQSVHTGPSPFACGECGKCFSIRSVLDAHRATHDRHKTWSCSECGKYFTQKSALVTHQRVHKRSTSTS